MSLRRIFALLSVLLLVALVTTGCPPDFPNCDTDEHCQDSEEGQEEDRLYCVNGLCQQCAEDDDCAEGEECAAGSCEAIPGYCQADADCEGDQVCRDNECGPECLDDDDCGVDEVCEGGSCVEEAECSLDADCDGDMVCENDECVEPPEETCELSMVHFPFDSSNLTDDARSALQDNADCIQERDLSIQIEGHCDERGTTEYNLALGERRANSVRDYLTSMGVSSDQISTTSYGDQQLQRRCGSDGSEDCHEENRRAVFNIQ